MCGDGTYDCGLRIADFGLRIDMAGPMTREVLQCRMRALAVATIRLTDELPRTRAADIIARQLVRSATSVAANYRSACRARSRRDFIAKMGIVEEEADETAFWLDLLEVCSLAPTTRIVPLTREAEELLAITVASIRTARMGRGARTANPQSAIRNPQCS
jgi:four helix bundle protein